MNTYLALLRGINVGGKNIIKMADLKLAFEELGYTKVTTYIQSGNVVFESRNSNKEELIKQIESGLSKKFGIELKVVLVSKEELETVVKKAPKDFGSDPVNYKYDVIFLKEPLIAKEVVKTIDTHPKVDKVYAGEGVLYFSRTVEKITSSRISKIVGTPAYKNMTIRNWNTTTRLLALMDEENHKSY